MIDYDSFSRCHLTDIFFRFSRGSKRVNGELTLSLFCALALFVQLDLDVGFSKFCAPPQFSWNDGFSWPTAYFSFVRVESCFQAPCLKIVFWLTNFW